MLTPSEAEIRERLDPRQVITAMESAFRQRYRSVVSPTRTQFKTATGIVLLMPCYDASTHLLGIKIVTVQEKPVRPEDRIQATYFLIDPETGSPTAIVPANYMTDLRTAAVSALATKMLARKEVRTLGIFGTGRQACAHVKVLPLVRNFERVLVCGRNANSAARFAEEMSTTGISVEPADVRNCMAESEVICTCTTSPVPVIAGSLIRPGTHLNLIGAFQPHTREVDSVAMERALLVVDTYEGALAEAGDLLIPMQEGVITRSHIHCDLHELISGKKTGRRNADDITLFKSLGCALEDLAVAQLLLSS